MFFNAVRKLWIKIKSHIENKNVWVMHLNKTIDFERRCGANATVKTLKLNRLRHILINIKYQKE